jgi:HKD family nuclease
MKQLCRDFVDIKIAMAYIKKKGFLIFSKSLNLHSPKAFSHTNFRVKLLVGLSETHYTTDHEPLRQLLHVRNDLGQMSKRLQIRYIPDSRFHPKMILLANRKKTALIIGSSNITQGGLRNNKEANLLLEAATYYPAIQNANTYFDWLWNHSDKLTDEILEIYAEDKEQFGKNKSEHNKGRLPRNRLPTGPIPKKEELMISIDQTEYPISEVAGHCRNCGKITLIPEKWLEYWHCEQHPGNQSILTKRKGAEIDLKLSGHETKDVEIIEGICNKKLRDRTICCKRFDLTADFTHQICSRCYDKRKKERKPMYRIPPRADYRDSFFYDVGKDRIFAKS